MDRKTFFRGLLGVPLVGPAVFKLGFVDPAKAMVSRATTYGAGSIGLTNDHPMYDASQPEPLESVMQKILDGWAPGVKLEVRDDPDFGIFAYEQQPMAVGEALQGLADEAMMGLRWENGRPVLYAPPHGKRLSGDYWVDGWVNSHLNMNGISVDVPEGGSDPETLSRLMKPMRTSTVD